MIPYYGLDRQYENLKEEILEATDRIMRGGIWINGPYTKRFEAWLGERTHTINATVVHSGTQALEFIARFQKSQIALLTEDNATPVVRIPNITYPATLNAFLNAGWNVELADTDKNGIILPDNNNDSYECFVGLYGASSIGNYHDRKKVIVDGAQHWLAAGDNVGIAMAISFDPTKNLPSSGNGGAIVTNRDDLYNFVTTAKNNGKPNHTISGTNSKMSELECAHMLVRTGYIDEWQRSRRYIRHFYLQEFNELPIRCLSKDFVLHADQKFVIYTEDRDRLLQYLIDNGIEAKIHYPYTLSELPISNDPRIISKPDLTSTSIHLVRGLISLPLYPELTSNEVEYIVSKVKSFYE